MQRAAILSLLCVLTLACSAAPKDTAIVVAVWSDLGIPTEIDAIRLDITGPTDTRSMPFQLTTGDQPGRTKLPVQVALVPPDNQGLPFNVKATALLGSAAIVSQEARLSFLPGQRRVLTLFLGRVCKGTVCDPSDTCSEGNCRGVSIQTASLPNYVPNSLPPPPDASAPSRLDSGSSEAGTRNAQDVGGWDLGADVRRPVDTEPDQPPDVPIPALDGGPDGGPEVSVLDGSADTREIIATGGAGGTTLPTGGTGGTALPTGGTGAIGAGGAGGSTTGGPDAPTGPALDTLAASPEVPADVPLVAEDGGTDTPPVACGAADQPCCATGTACTGGGCCAGSLCVASGSACSTSAACVAGDCIASAKLVASTLSLGFGPVATSQASDVGSFTITNTGKQISGVLSVGASGTEFAIKTGVTGDCISKQTILAEGESCTVRVVFTPSLTGARSALLTFSATPGGNGSVSVSGAGISPGSLVVSAPSVAFGPVASGSPSSVGSFTLTNNGQQASGPIDLNSSSTEFVIQGGGTGDCATGTRLGANESCTVRMVFTPTSVGAKSETISYAATPGGSGAVTVTGSGILASCKLGAMKLGACKLGAP